MSDIALASYAHALMDDVHAQAEMFEGDLSLAFTELVLDQFSADGLTEDARAVAYKAHGVEISGWGLSGDKRCLDLFLTQYSPRADVDHKISKTDAATLFRRAEQFLARSLEDAVRAKEPGDEVVEMASSIASTFPEVDSVRILVITNARSTLRGGMTAAEIGGRPVSRELWDLGRLANWASSGNKAEPIVAEFPSGLPCLATDRTDEDYSVFLAIVPAQDLAQLYSEHGARLLELNVRSFLQIRSRVNRGILETLKSHPQRFLAYNNGISATASQVEMEQRTGVQVITRIHSMQIVNGGQTTATIHHAAKNKVDLGEALVQMKLTVVAPEQLSEIVPQISAYSNTQNKVTASDLRANSGFHVEVERVMRTLWAPAAEPGLPETHWFYERARGQYATALAKEGTRARQRAFRISNPAAQRFSKSELAKYMNVWSMLPYEVVLGAEKNFTLFSERISKVEPLVDKDFCRHLVAKALLFRHADKIIAKQDFGGYKANIVAYTVAKLVHVTRSGLDLDRIWRDQGLSPALRAEIEALSPVVREVLVTPPVEGANVNEWTKRPTCWEAVKRVPWPVSEALQSELIEVDTYNEDLALIRSTTETDWRELAAWGSSTGHLRSGDELVVEEVARSLGEGYDAAGKYVSAGVELMRQAQSNGFRAVRGF
jgi:AIPR protein